MALDKYGNGSHMEARDTVSRAEFQMFRERVYRILVTTLELFVLNNIEEPWRGAQLQRVNHLVNQLQEELECLTLQQDHLAQSSASKGPEEAAGRRG